MKNMLGINQLRKNRNENNFQEFNAWVKEFFRREYLRDYGDLNDYQPSHIAMREEVKYWNPNRSKHAEVHWLENFVFGRSDISMRNKILNAMAVKFVGMPTLTLVASNTADYNNIIDFDRYENDLDYRKTIQNNLNNNIHKLAVWGSTQLQTSLQTAARNYCRDLYNNPDKKFQLSDMIDWMLYLDKLGLSETVMDRESTLGSVCEHLKQHRGIGPYFSYHPPCNFSRATELYHIDEDDDYCLVGPGAKRGLEFVFPDIKFSNNDIMEEYIIGIRDHQHDFFEFKDNTEYEFYKKNLERGGNLTTFGVEITLCQFDCFQNIKDNARAQEKRIVPLTFDSFVTIAENLKLKMNQGTLEQFI